MALAHLFARAAMHASPLGQPVHPHWKAKFSGAIGAALISACSTAAVAQTSQTQTVPANTSVTVSKQAFQGPPNYIVPSGSQLINDVNNINAVTNNSEGLLAEATTHTPGFSNLNSISVLVNNGFAINNPGAQITGSVTNNSAGILNNSGLIDFVNAAGISQAVSVVNSGIFNNIGAPATGVLPGGYIFGNVSNSGTFNNVNGATINGTVFNSGTFNNASSGLILASVNNQGTFNNAATGTIQGSVNNGGTFINGGTIQGSVSNGGTFTNTGLITSGSVTNNVMFTNNGTVSGSFINAPGATLCGTGTYGSLVNSGTVCPGNSIGTFTVTGTFTHLGGTYQVQVNGSGQSDLIAVGGTASVQGGAVSVYAYPGTNYAARTTYTILTAAGGVSGTYPSLVDPYPFLLAGLSADANNVYLTVQIGGFAAAASNANQYAVGQVLDANVNGASGDFGQVLSAIATNTLTSAQAQATLTMLSGQNYSTFSSTMVQGAQLFMSNFADQTGGGSGGGSGANARVALAEACEVACDRATPALWGAWGGALGGLGTIGANTGTGAVTYNAGGFAAGLDRLVAPGLRVGVTSGYTSGTQWTDGFSGQGRTDTVLAGLYGNYRMDKVYADAMVGYAYGYNQMWRQIVLPGLQPRTAQSGAGANQFFGQVETGYRIDLGAAADAFVTPFARLQGYTGTQNGFTETGAQSLNLTVAQQTTNSLRSVIGAQLGGALDLGWREKLALQLRLGWAHEYASTARPVTATLAGAPLMAFTTYGVAPQRDGAVLGVSANTAIADATSIYLRYEGTVSGADSAHALTAGVRMSW
jgi:uncharacterized protein with beta-barrel porin domain